MALYFLQEVTNRNHLSQMSQKDMKCCLLHAELQVCRQAAADLRFLLKRCSQIVEYQLLHAAFTLRIKTVALQ